MARCCRECNTKVTYPGASSLYVPVDSIDFGVMRGMLRLRICYTMNVSDPAALRYEVGTGASGEYARGLPLLLQYEVRVFASAQTQHAHYAKSLNGTMQELAANSINECVFILFANRRLDPDVPGCMYANCLPQQSCAGTHCRTFHLRIHWSFLSCVAVASMSAFARSTITDLNTLADCLRTQRCASN
jgi:hypothetical protein